MAQNHALDGLIKQEIPWVTQKTAKPCYNLEVNHEILIFGDLESLACGRF
jgi:hypothetical protein